MTCSPYGKNSIGLAVPDLDKRSTSSFRINASTLKVYLIYSATILNTFRFEKFAYGPRVHACGLQVTSKRTKSREWLGRAMVLGSFQCRGVLLLWHMVGHGMLCLQQVRDGWAVFVYSFISSILSSFSSASSVGRWLDILKYCGLGRYNPAIVVIYYRRRAR